jgi:tetratricopeptide (TPR) repeat protein
MTALRASAAVVLLAGLSSCTYWTNDLERIVDMSERNFEEGAVGYDFKDVDLREVAANASSYRYVALRFQGILCRRNENLFAPFFSQMKADDFHNFSVWPIDAKIWQEKDRMTFFPTLYIHKGNKDLDVLIQAPRYSIFEIRGYVASDFQDRPLVEVVDLRLVAPGVFTDESLAQLQSGYTALEQKRPAVAIDRFEKALGGIWSRSARLMVRMQLASLYFERGEFEAALGHYEGALINDPGNAEATEGAAKCRAEIARKAAAAGAAAPAPQ